MFKWLKRLKNIELEETSNLNGLYTARIGDLKKIDKAIGKINKNIETINTTIGNINNRIDQFPSPNHIAVKNETNTFEEIQEIKTTSPYLAFRKPNNQRKGYIGTPASSSNDIELKAETNSLILNANHNINLTSGNGYNTLIDKDPNVDNAVANKRYVDTQIAAVATPDLTPYARKDQENVFSQKQTVNNEIVAASIKLDYGEVQTTSQRMESIVNMSTMLSQGYAKLRDDNEFLGNVNRFQGATFKSLNTLSGYVDGVSSDAKSLVNKAYVDSRTNLQTNHDTNTNYRSSKLRMRRHVNSVMYGYEALGGEMYIYSNHLTRGKWLLLIRITGIRSGDGNRSTTCSCTIPEVVNYSGSGSVYIQRVYFLIWSWVDLNTAGGDFDGIIDYETVGIRIGDY